MSTLFLSSHCYACTCEGYLVFLDARNGFYSCLPPSQATSVINAFRHQEQNPKSEISTTILHDASIQELLKSNILTTLHTNGKNLFFEYFEKPVNEIVGTGHFESPTITINSFIRFLWSLTLGFLIWKCLPFRAIHWLRRHQYENNPDITNDISPDRLSVLVDIFFYLAPFFYTTKDHCFLTSAAMTIFLRSHNIRASWIFGVTMEPFIAHCWTQVGNTVVADNLFRVWRFTPIMSI